MNALTEEQVEAFHKSTNKEGTKNSEQWAVRNYNAWEKKFAGEPCFDDLLLMDEESTKWS